MKKWPALLANSLFGMGIAELKIPKEDEESPISIEGSFETSNSKALKKYVTRAEPVMYQGVVYCYGKPVMALFEVLVFNHDQFTVRVVATSAPTAWEVMQEDAL